VPAEHVEDARAALSRAAGVESVEDTGGQLGGLVVRFASAGDDSGTAALHALAEAGVPVLAFELEGARLSDAFLAMTGAR
jgi:ABC-2 type transport system ATP-binding protein